MIQLLLGGGDWQLCATGCSSSRKHDTTYLLLLSLTGKAYSFNRKTVPSSWYIFPLLPPPLPLPVPSPWQKTPKTLEKHDYIHVEVQLLLISLPTNASPFMDPLCERHYLNTLCTLYICMVNKIRFYTKKKAFPWWLAALFIYSN